jgi:hypothetical protein
MKYFETTCKKVILKKSEAAKKATYTRLKEDFFEENTYTNQ